MAKGKKPYGYRKLSGGDITGFDDEASIASSTTLSQTCRSYQCEDDVDEAHDFVDTYVDALEKLEEKRTSVRVKGYEELSSYLRAGVHASESERHCETLIELCLKSLRKGGDYEKEVASVVLGLHFISMPEDVYERLWDLVKPQLEKVALECDSSEAQTSAIECLAMCCFVTCEEPCSTKDIMSLLRRIYKMGDRGTSRAAALRAWSLLFISLSSQLVASEVECVLLDMADLLVGSRNVDVRTAAGEIVALIHSAYGVLNLEDLEKDGDDDCNACVLEGKSNIVMHEEGADHAERIESLVERMQDLATHNHGDALRASKRNKAAQRVVFRSILGKLERRSCKAEKVKLASGYVLEITTHDGQITLSAFRRLLGGGLQVHLQDNPLLHAIFDFLPRSQEGNPGKQMKRNSGAAKGKTKERKNERVKKESSRLANC
ncbi:hypothetical protein CEUSTIGMA_g9596.t1 [Chlamydomonas eustigma]|uniref:Interferon-related developmental regulator N-terminal domain-containing protein n=1 Tax=Chlamydomonas eustigma TaxID=1157962 RepID=A0A250XGG5_9CHLO|nr:hypothetical protein CEUSTIGMA_g9596.t1 [Chlamydomonas eustigma]|eukprot:GAX82168.1 hypothetical protein CEUSTIGMA_g9596.t1 [Chlamydomonas eustigma]